MPDRHPLAGLSGTVSGIQFSGRFVSDLFFSGPGAGPDVTAATILDDVAEAVTTVQRFPRRPWACPRVESVSAPATAWFVRARFPGVVPDPTAATRLLSAQGLSVQHVTDAIGDARWLRIGAARREDLDRAIANLAHTNRVQAHGIRAL